MCILKINLILVFISHNERTIFFSQRYGWMFTAKPTPQSIIRKATYPANYHPHHQPHTEGINMEWGEAGTDKLRGFQTNMYLSYEAVD